MTDSKKMMRVPSVQRFPAEVLEHIFNLLEPIDLKSAVLVCRRWREIGEAPKLWTWVHIWVNRGNLANMPIILASRRLQNIKTIAVRSFSEELITAIMKHSHIRKLDLSDADWSLSTFDPNIVKTLIFKMNDVTLDMCTLSDNQTIGLSEALESTPHISGFRIIDCSGAHQSSSIVRVKRLK